MLEDTRAGSGRRHHPLGLVVAGGGGWVVGGGAGAAVVAGAGGAVGAGAGAGVGAGAGAWVAVGVPPDEPPDDEPPDEEPPEGWAAGVGVGCAAGWPGTGTSPGTVVTVTVVPGSIPGTASTITGGWVVVGSVGAGVVSGAAVVAAGSVGGSTASVPVSVLESVAGWFSAASTVVSPNTAEAASPVVRMRAPAATCGRRTLALAAGVVEAAGAAARRDAVGVGCGVVTGAGAGAADKIGAGAG
ncbi:MAG: hypothetical protein KDB06_04575 [Ilumatobacter sp.]|nr:hypothetical protein [Ilumatobacter sp.]